MPRKLASPEKELRFTRSGQAPPYWIASAMLCAAALTLAVSSFYRGENPALPHPLWALLPLTLAWLAARLAIRLTRHAYIILTPVGVEIFPFFRPARNMRMVAWSEIHAAELAADRRLLTLHFDAAQSAGVHLSLRPVRRDRLALLSQALHGRLPRTAAGKS